ncbi:uncharacterized protein B0H18DRAFT_1113801 [Fomitopsis serialis]|uniref:uncharacterized protein n=1 Tax=Fomitopsis serialis TaxID=139415 RepID=UPI002008B25F|nr:uncharacterized protein B0H18DRAFT_1113801 [Neoantrodia serialis]KAH9936406.1 hypothetical protein B0H18DRAFT_1113801 [Neoantrodia serialis]
MMHLCTSRHFHELLSQIFFNVYKPSTPFAKTASTARLLGGGCQRGDPPMPTLTELIAVFDVLPQWYYQNRHRRFVNLSLIRKLPVPTVFAGAFSSPTPAETARKVNLFLSSKTAKTMVVIAAVDTGMISFFRFGEGVFTQSYQDFFQDNDEEHAMELVFGTTVDDATWPMAQDAWLPMFLMPVFTATTVQLFYAWRIAKLSQSRLFSVIIIFAIWFA